MLIFDPTGRPRFSSPAFSRQKQRARSVCYGCHLYRASDAAPLANEGTQERDAVSLCAPDTCEGTEPARVIRCPGSA
jgi:hypothetical protein